MEIAAGAGNIFGPVHGFEGRQNLTERNIEKGAPIANIFHMPLAFLVELVKQRIFAAVEFQRFEAEPVAESPVKGRVAFTQSPSIRISV